MDKLSPDTKSKNTVNTELTREEVEQLHQIKLLEEIKRELIVWAKRQVWLFLIVISILVAFGIHQTIDILVDRKIKQNIAEKEAIITHSLDIMHDATVEGTVEAKRIKATLFSLEEMRSSAQESLDLLKIEANQLQKDFANINANINSLREGLKKNTENLQIQIGGIASKTSVDISSSKQKILNFEANSEYTVLVFYTLSQKVIANDLKESLLSEGYRSSSTATDFSELSKVYSSGTISINYTNRGTNVVEKIEEMLTKKGLSGSFKIQKSITPLRRGDVQILIF
ncbi:hypothetical protein [Psychrilyobacter atlanticus]|uniref:hypothetical protein n=1 Tax=Psychrilyobacter atlanticus TaxID=271091 RepID=UPI0003FC6FBB|nr:hypothetical protein [Psychrilyobacter atlanticus]